MKLYFKHSFLIYTKVLLFFVDKYIRLLLGGMELRFYILDKVLEFKNDKKELDNIFNEINQVISDSNCILYCLDIDGKQIYDDYYEYFFENIAQINEVKAITKTFDDLVMDTIISTKDYLDRAIPEIERLADDYYRTPTQDSWNHLAQLLEALQWIMNSFFTIDKNCNIEKVVKSYEAWNLYAKDVYSLKDLMYEFEEVLNSQDYISIADILAYEIFPLFKQMINKLSLLVGEEEDGNVIN